MESARQSAAEPSDGLVKAVRVRCAEEASARGVALPPDHVPAIVPFLNRELVSVSAEARSRFAAHLQQVAKEYFSAIDREPQHPRDRVAEPAAELPDAVAEKLAIACTACQGWCCQYGLLEHAYIDADVIARWHAQHPRGTAEEFVEDYLGRVPTEHFSQSCLYHSQTGCALPRSMRADTCNRFLCEGAANLLVQTQRSPQTVGMVAAVDREQIHRVLPVVE